MDGFRSMDYLDMSAKKLVAISMNLSDLLYCVSSNSAILKNPAKEARLKNSRNFVRNPKLQEMCIFHRKTLNIMAFNAQLAQFCSSSFSEI